MQARRTELAARQPVAARPSPGPARPCRPALAPARAYGAPLGAPLLWPGGRGRRRGVMHMHEERGGGSIVPSKRRRRDGAGGGGPGAAGGAEGGLSAWSCAGQGPRQRAGPGQAEVSGLGGAGRRGAPQASAGGGRAGAAGAVAGAASPRRRTRFCLGPALPPTCGYLPPSTEPSDSFSHPLSLCWGWPRGASGLWGAS